MNVLKFPAEQNLTYTSQQRICIFKTREHAMLTRRVRDTSVPIGVSHGNATLTATERVKKL
jgi:hypothetical protein